MKALVAVKRVIDYQALIRVKADGSGVETTQVKMSMNPFDEIAMEEAVRLKEKGVIEEIVAISIGPDAAQEVLRTALAMGANRAILIKTDESIEPLNVAKILKFIAQEEKPHLVLLGKQAIDSDDNQVGQMLAGLMNCSQGTFASLLQFAGERLQVTREIDGGLETLSLSLPAIITTDLRLNQPRYLSLPNIVQAKRKPLTIRDLNSLGLSLRQHSKQLRVDAPPKRKAGLRVQTVAELVQRLKEEAKVLQ